MMGVKTLMRVTIMPKVNVMIEVVRVTGDGDDVCWDESR